MEYTLEPISHVLCGSCSGRKVYQLEQQEEWAVVPTILVLSPVIEVSVSIEI